MTTTASGFGFFGGPTVVITQPCQRPHLAPGCVGVPAEFLRDVLRLSHPDLHTEGRQERAHKVSAFCTQMLKALEESR